MTISFKVKNIPQTFDILERNRFDYNVNSLFDDIEGEVEFESKVDADLAFKLLSAKRLTS